ncbi:MAG: hypothetical protein ACR2G4_01905 [Pyrinomonadaceae bacterium]
MNRTEDFVAQFVDRAQRDDVDENSCPGRWSSALEVSCKYIPKEKKVHHSPAKLEFNPNLECCAFEDSVRQKE